VSIFHTSCGFFCVDFIVGEICIVHCVPYNLFIFSMKRNHYTVEFKSKEEGMSNLAAQWHHRNEKTNIRWWKKQKEQLYTARRMMFCGRTMIKKCLMMTWSPTA
jgi:hypothetical protein